MQVLSLLILVVISKTVYVLSFRVFSALITWLVILCLTKEELTLGGGGTPYNGLYGEAPPERGTFFRLEVFKRVGISRPEV